MFNFKALLIVALLCILPFLLYAEKIAVLDFKTIGVDPSLAEATTALLRTDLASYKNLTVIEKSVMEGIPGVKLECENKKCAADIGSRINADKVVYGTISKLGEKYIISAFVVKVSSKSIVFQDRITATSAEDLDITSKRLAKSIATGKKVAKTAEIGAITEEETKEPRRRTSFYTGGIKFGWGLPLGGDSYGGVNSLISYDAIGWYETPNFMVELMFGISRSSGYTFFDTTVSASEFYPEISIFYLLSKGDFCPFVGGGMGMRFLTIEKDFFDMETATALGINLGGGIILFRTYDFRIVLDGRYSINFADLPTYGGPHSLLKISFGVTYRSTGGGCGGGFGGGGCL
ncbi:hypothetical protein KAU34_07955 [candidate division WOR-3 bacterium]|nr:hypothetical protein [candidate division WOR-3 bacterium]